MTPRLLALSCAALIATSAYAQEPVSRYAVAIGASMPQELKAESGVNLGFNIYVNQQSPRGGRIRLEAVAFGKKSESNPFGVLESEGTAWTLGYDWTPGNERVRAVLGAGVMSWTQEVHLYNLGYKSYGGNRSGFAVVPTLGIQFRASRFIAVEARYAFPINATNEKNYYFAYGADNSIRQMNYATVGLEIRFPRFR
ncbi:MAG: hypothetical protein H6P99_1170 [Holophagaceae bacterium]|nr:hypothetical protein [Holophagaceae bacterium]